MEVVSMRPTVFSKDCIRCVDYIKEKKILFIDLTGLNATEGMRFMDYVQGGAYLMKAALKELAKDAFYCVVPDGVTYIPDDGGATASGRALQSSRAGSASDEDVIKTSIEG